MSKICAVYALLNTKTGETYIGSSIDLNNRIDFHLAGFAKNIGVNRRITKALEEHGVEAFTFVITEECTAETQYEREQFWLDYWLPEYNITNKAAKNNLGVTMPLETKIIQSMQRIGNQHKKGKNRIRRN